ncbi:MAG: LacI family transcriptional regulator [Flavobacteriaceae bacterium]|nr:LacI family transcriptional regulator [Flavobacteriaceae bacterium]
MNKIPKKLNISEIAKQLGVSKSTVSKALNNSYEISALTKKKVQEFAKKHNYKANKLAVNLKSGTTKTIGVILPSIQNFFFAQVLKGIESVATAEDYNIITSFSNESFTKEVNSIDLLTSGMVDGFVLALAEETQIKKEFSHLSEALQEDKKMVMFDRVTDSIECDKVCVNDFEAAYNATKHLINLKCKHIAVVSTINHLSVGKLRMEGYKRAVDEFFKTIDKDLLLIGTTSNIDFKIVNLLKNKQVNAILALDEDAVLATYKVTKFKGYNLPKDMAVIGYASEKMAANLTPSLTTLNQHGELIGKATVQLLLDKLKHKENTKFEQKLMKTTLVERDSTKAYRFNPDN